MTVYNSNRMSTRQRYLRWMGLFNAQQQQQAERPEVVPPRTGDEKPEVLPPRKGCGQEQAEPVRG